LKNLIVIGATGDVGQGIVGACVHRGHQVLAIARNADRLEKLVSGIDHAGRLRSLIGSLESDSSATRLLGEVQALLPKLDGVVISVNGRRQPATLLSHSSDSLTRVIQGDLIAHYSAARAFLAALVDGGTYIGIGGGSCDFILEGGIPQSVAQAGLRMLYRGLAHELGERPRVHLRELIIASVVNGTSTREFAEPGWVTDREIGEHVVDIIESPAAYPEPIRRIARRDATGRPVVSADGAVRVQGFRQP
jgi:NAD(P)-dependent dehydrogenase (short-subunit alcohol dehydrogenase family)